MSKGIILLALGHPNYARMAAALAASIRMKDDSIPIALLHDGDVVRYLKREERDLFAMDICIESYYYTNEDGSFNPLKARIHYYELSPFTKTLSIDVDNIWLQKKKVSDVFNELDGVPFTIQNAGYQTCDENIDPGMSVWAPIQGIINAYGLSGKRWYKTYGDWLYFEKSNAAKKLMGRAKKIFMSPPKADVCGFIGQTIPDELAYSIAIAQTEVHPHKDDYHATSYYHVTSLKRHRLLHPYQLGELYFTLSMGGSTTPIELSKTYNTISSAAYQAMGLQHPYKWQDKRNFLQVRKNM